MEEKDLLQKLEELAKPVIEGEGLVLYDTEYKRERSGWIVRFYIFRVDGYISIDDCVKVSRQLNTLLDVEDLIDHPYNLEVSSPGMERFLRKLEHFKMAIGETIKVKTKESVEGRKTFTGKLISLEGKNIILKEDKKNTIIDFDNIQDAKVQIDYFKGVKR
ncbi:MAG: ribosome maturation factor RimP [Proteobacteria bacterium]|nr:ribosome maturation factor RimP [Pseudomonadota bacterium]